MKIHIDIGQYEFIEIEKDEFTPQEVMELWEKFHKLTEKKKQARVDKIAKQEDSFINELDDETIVI